MESKFEYTNKEGKNSLTKTKPKTKIETKLKPKSKFKPKPSGFLPYFITVLGEIHYDPVLAIRFVHYIKRTLELNNKDMTT